MKHSQQNQVSSAQEQTKAAGGNGKLEMSM